jgi:hypothetical protein
LRDTVVLFPLEAAAKDFVQKKKKGHQTVKHGIDLAVKVKRG